METFFEIGMILIILNIQPSVNKLKTNSVSSELEDVSTIFGSSEQVTIFFVVE